MVACRYEISLPVLNSASHLYAVLTCELLSWTIKEKFHILVCPYITLYNYTPMLHVTVGEVYNQKLAQSVP